MDGSTQRAWQARKAWYAGTCVIVCLAVLSALPGLAAAKAHAKTALGFTISPKRYRLSVKVTTKPQALCKLTVSSHKKSATLPKLRANKSGKVTFTWGVPINAPSGTWTFLVQCSRARKTFKLKKSATILTGGNGTEGVIQWDSLSQQAPTSGGKGAGLPRVTVAVPDKRGLPDPGNDYPAALLVKRDSVLDQWGEENRECTSFVAWALATRNGFNMPFYDNATGWGPDARARGYTVNSTPAPGSVAWEPAGHVAYVENVVGGDVQIEEYNEHYPSNPGTYDTRTVPAGNFQYIHFADVRSPPSGGGGNPTSSGPTAGIDASGSEYVYWRGTDNNIYEAWYSASLGTWNGPANLGGGNVNSAPSAIVTGNGDQYVYWKGSDNNLWEIWYSASQGAWFGPKNLGDGPLG